MKKISFLFIFLVFVSCQKKDLVRVPFVKTGNVSNLSEKSVEIGGEGIDAADTEAIFGHCYATSPNPTVAQSKTQVGTTRSPKVFLSRLTDLQANTNYYVRAYLQAGDRIVYGQEQSFKTESIIPTTLTTGTASNITETSAQMTGNISALGTGVTGFSQHGHCYSSTNNLPSVGESRTSLGQRSSTGNFVSTLTNLSPNTTYYVRGYVEKGGEIIYGTTQTFKTLTPPEPDSFLKKITIITFPSTKNGLFWDPCDFSNPDIYLVITMKNGTSNETIVNTKTQTPSLVISDVSPTAKTYFEFTTGLLLRKNQNYTIEIWDRDTGLCGSDEIVGYIPLNISTYTVNTTKINERNNGVEMELEVFWK